MSPERKAELVLFLVSIGVFAFVLGLSVAWDEGIARNYAEYTNQPSDSEYIDFETKTQCARDY